MQQCMCYFSEMAAKVILVAQFKGGCTKTTCAMHLALRADELGLKVVAYDCDTQGGLFRRLTDAEPSENDESDFGDIGYVIASPNKYDTDWEADLIVVDGKGTDYIPAGSAPDLVVMPINCVDAIREAGETVHRIRVAGLKSRVMLVANNLMDKSAVEALRGMRLPKRVVLHEQFIRYSPAIVRSDILCAAAWNDTKADRGAKDMLAWCNSVLTEVAHVKAA